MPLSVREEQKGAKIFDFWNFPECGKTDGRKTLCGLHFAVVCDKLDLPSTEGRLDKEKI